MKMSCKSWLYAPACAVLAVAPAGCATKSSDLSALPPACPRVAPAANGAGDAEFAGLGCANWFNLTKMVADQNDLEIGGTLGPADGAREALAVEAYKGGKAKELKKVEPTTSIGAGAGGAK